MAVLNKHHGNIPAGAVYIGRGSKWGNPFHVGPGMDRDAACENYERHLVRQIEDGRVTWAELAQLHGKDLVCFCAPQRCHGHTLEQYAQSAYLTQQQQPKLPEFKLIVAGGRDFNNIELLTAELFRLANGELKDYDVSIVSGMARGADRLGWEFAQTNGVACHEFPADWDRYGKRAGFVRNEAMGRFADGLLAFWDGRSRGTAQMIQFMESLGKPVRTVRYGSA